MLCQLSYAPITTCDRKNAPLARSQLPLQGSNLDFPDPESGVLPVTPRGSGARSLFQGLCSTGEERKERETGLEPATLSLGS